MNSAPVSIRILLMPLNSAMARKARRQARRAWASSVLAAGCRSELKIWLMRSRDYQRERRDTTLEQKYGYFVSLRPRSDQTEGGYRGDRRRFWRIPTLFSFRAIQSGPASGRLITAIGPDAELEIRARSIGPALGRRPIPSHSKLAVD